MSERGDEGVEDDDNEDGDRPMKVRKPMGLGSRVSIRSMRSPESRLPNNLMAITSPSPCLECGFLSVALVAQKSRTGSAGTMALLMSGCRCGSLRSLRSLSAMGQRNGWRVQSMGNTAATRSPLQRVLAEATGDELAPPSPKQSPTPSGTR